MDALPTVFPAVELRDLSPGNGITGLYGRSNQPEPIDIDNNAHIDLVTFVVTDNAPAKNYGELMLYMLKATKKLNRAAYVD